MVPLIFKYEEYLIIGVLKGFAERTGALCRCARRPEDRESRRGDQRRAERAEEGPPRELLRPVRRRLFQREEHAADGRTERRGDTGGRSG